MRLGLQLPNLTLPGGPAKLGENLANAARWAEEIGMESVWMMDHFFQIEFVGPVTMEMLEGYTTLAYLAAVTKKVRLGTMVTGVTYRYPGILTKTVTTLDVLSGGRAWFGVGAAWFEREHQALGVPFPSLKVRFEYLEEALQIALQMWSPNNGPYIGKHFRLEETLCSPQPLSKPHPPILIGGMGEKKTLRLVAQYAQACNFFAGAGSAALKHKLAVLRQHCDRLGRNFNDIERTTLDVFRPSDKDAFLRKLTEQAELGFDTAIFSVSDPTDRKLFDLLGRDVVPFAAQLQTKGR
jgi:F420-dependent oxidoreductase-like protein